MLTVSLVTYRQTPEELKPLYDSLKAATNVEKTIVVDNSFDNRGFGRAHNIAIRQAMEKGAKYHLVVNPDISFRPGTLEAIERFMDEHPDVGVVMPKTVFPNGEMQYSARLLPTPFDVFARRFLPSFLFRRRNERYELRAADYTKPFEVAYLRGCFLFFRMDCLREVGLFDERFFLYPEDVDLSRRIYASGKWHVVCLPTVEVTHSLQQASYRSWRLMVIHSWNMMLYFNKWGWVFDRGRRKANADVIKSVLNHHQEEDK